MNVNFQFEVRQLAAIQTESSHTHGEILRDTRSWIRPIVDLE